MQSSKPRLVIFTGNGKGKTTSALGVVLQSVGAGEAVYFGQFLKDGNYSEKESLKRLGITYEAFGRAGFIRGEPDADDFRMAHDGFSKIKEAVMSGKYGLVVADELNIAIFKGLVPLDDVLDLASHIPTGTELVITGRYADERLIRLADSATEMCEVRHYYTQGISARRGIEK